MRTAKRIVLSHGSDRSERDRAALDDSTFQSSLRRAHDSASEGDVWEEFLGTGCGSTQDVVLRVEHVEGGAKLAPDTRIEYSERDQPLVDS